MENHERENPPLGDTWQKWYLAVLLTLLIQILIYHLITQKYSWAF
jgi:hypothetical protein